MSRPPETARAFAHGFRQGWNEARLSRRATLIIVIAAAAVTGIALILSRGLG